MSNNTLLPTTTQSSSSRCSTCLTTAPKYRCPRCSARSCSLACVRTHKARNLCSGIRNATTYLSRRQLATPTAFDADFNLLAGIERGLERAERVFALSHQKSRTEHRARDVDGDADGDMNEHEYEDEHVRQARLAKAIACAGVTVWRAPKGVVRRKENGTRIEGRRRYISWTVEWRFLGMRILGSASELGSLAQAHDHAVLDAYRNESSKVKKAILKEYIDSTGVTVPEGYRGRKDLMHELGLLDSQARVEYINIDSHDDMDARDEPAEAESIESVSTKEEPVTELELQPISNQLSALEGSDPTIASPELAQQPLNKASTRITSTTSTTQISRRQFLIHRPELSTAQRQMVSIVDGQTSLRDVLRGKTVREFPMILVDVLGLDEVDRSQWHLVDEMEAI